MVSHQNRVWPGVATPGGQAGGFACHASDAENDVRILFSFYG